uniref:(northern house mosquito) hypothetical protein n=1 Tax=Culex pipiens TaxID=7175 RepID=A0A8D8BSZ8_CULPI
MLTHMWCECPPQSMLTAAVLTHNGWCLHMYAVDFFYVFITFHKSAPVCCMFLLRYFFRLRSDSRTLLSSLIDPQGYHSKTLNICVRGERTYNRAQTHTQNL